jgi:hypothetical protein
VKAFIRVMVGLIILAGAATGVLVFNALPDMPVGEASLYAGISGFAFGIAGVFLLAFSWLVEAD